MKYINILVVMCVICGILTGCGLKLDNDNPFAESTTKELLTSETVSEERTSQTTTQHLEILTGKKSSYTNPLKKGEIGICQLINDGASMENVSIRLNATVRGDSAKRIIDKVVKDNESISFSKIPTDCEFIIIDVDIALNEKEKKDICLPVVSMMVKGTEGKDLKFNNSIYKTLSSYVYWSSSDRISYGQIVNCKLVSVIPIGCNEFAFEFGCEEGDKAIFRE